MKISEIVKKYMEERGLKQEAFVAELNKSLRNTGLSRVSISNWLNERNEPDTDFLLLVMMVYSDWRMEFAIDCLCAKLPEVFVRDERGALMTLKQSAS